MTEASAAGEAPAPEGRRHSGARFLTILALAEIAWLGAVAFVLYLLLH